MHILSSSLLIVFVLLIRILFREKVPYRLLYLLWVPVFLRLMIPGTVYDFTFLPTEHETVLDSAFEWLSNDADITEEPSVPSEEVSSDHQAPQTSQSVSSKDILYIIYLLGCVAVGCRFCMLALSVRRRLHFSRRFLQMHGKIRVYRTDSALAPCVHGLIPAIYLTDDMEDPESIALVLEHEAMHIKHLDFIRVVLRRLAAVLYWWNPLVWLYIRFAAEDAELACDEAVAKRLDCGMRLQYAHTIYALLPQNRNGSLGFGGKPLKRRLGALTSRTAPRVPMTVLAAVLVLAVSAMCACGLAVKVSPSLQENVTSDDWCAELFPDDFPVPIYDEIYEIVRDGDVVTVTLFSEPGPVSDFLPSHNLRKRLGKHGYVNFYDYDTHREYFLNKQGYNVTINDSVTAGWLYELNKQNPYGYTYQIKLEKLSHSYESIFWQYPYKKTDLGLQQNVFDGYPTEYLPAQLPRPSEELNLHLTRAEQLENGVFLQYTGELYDFWRYNRVISDAGFYFIETGDESFFFVNDEGDYLFARIVSMSIGERGHDVFEYQVCKRNPHIKK